MRNYLNVLICISCMISMHASAVDFLFYNNKGTELRLSDYKGKWVLVNFWATWCSPCLEEIPDLVSMHDTEINSDFAVIGVAINSTKISVNYFMDKFKINYPIVFGDLTISNQFGGVKILPTSFLFDQNGNLLAKHEGLVSRQSIKDFVLLSNKKGSSDFSVGKN